MAKLTQNQIDELKELGFITQVVPSDNLADNTVDDLKIKEFITKTDPSDDIEAAVTEPVVHVESVELDNTELALHVGESASLVATVLPEDATYPEVTWESSDANIATVDNNGVVVAAGSGSASITATADSKSASCAVTVTESEDAQ